MPHHLKLTGPIGSATETGVPEFAPSTCLTSWFLDLPPAHPFWPRYMLSVVHLREEPGMKPAILLYPEATHELMIGALDPQFNPVPHDASTWKWMQPFNVVHQFHGLSDGQAKALAQWAAGEVVEGRLWVETSDRMGEQERWKQALGERVALLGREQLA